MLLRHDILKIIYPRSEAVVRGRRFTQDTAVIPDVWVAYGQAESPSTRIKLLLTPQASSDVQTLVQALLPRLARERGMLDRLDEVFLAYNDSHVLVQASYRELIRAILPLSAWWQQTIPDPASLGRPFLERLELRDDFVEMLLEPGYQDLSNHYPEGLLDFVRIAGAIQLKRAIPNPEPGNSGEMRQYVTDLMEAFYNLTEGISLDGLPAQPPLWAVFGNRSAEGAISKSRLAVKADAAVRLFDVSCRGLVWAVIDGGIDARHPAFIPAAKTGALTPEKAPTQWCPQDKPQDGVPASAVPSGAAPCSCRHFASSRILRTYDFTRFEALLTSNFTDTGKASVFDALDEDQQREIRRDLQRRLLSGQPLDWKLLDPLLRVPHVCGSYIDPENEHGTHVAGILAADWRRPDPSQGAAPPAGSGGMYPPNNLIGMCPDLDIYDLRVFDKDGVGDEFGILAALQFVRYLNQGKDQMVLHGVNLSFSLPHAVDSFACGSTPVCEECERLVGSGVTVVAAAGNRGFRHAPDSQFEDYRNISVTDPGNADGVITVGATHRFMPHKYGVSYFSSRGPTGDGRLKPDLVAPGEKIESTIPKGRWATLDGTSMAAPHVSGAAALLMARHGELLGKPARIKEILCSTATDLARERYFQGAGMVDVLRALQSV